MTNNVIERMRQQRMSRRQLLNGLSAAGVTLAVMPVLRRPAAAAEQATYFTWGGYDDPNLFKPFSEKHGSDPEYALFGESEEALTKLRSGFVVDVAHPCNAGIQRWRASGLFQPIDTGRLSNWPDVMDSIKSIHGAQDDGGQWFVPVEWGQTSITYRADLIDWQGAEESWGLLWDERYAGKLSIIDSVGDSWWCTAIYAGVDLTNVTDDDIETVNGLLREQRPLLRMYSNDMTSVEQALASGELVAAMTWNESTASLRSQGIDVRFANPKEGALTWACGVMLHKDAPKLDQAYDVINSLIDPVTGEYMIDAFGYGHCNLKSFERVSEERLAELGLSKDPWDIINKGVFQQPQSQELETRINRDFDEIKSGF